MLSFLFEKSIKLERKYFSPLDALNGASRYISIFIVFGCFLLAIHYYKRIDNDASIKSIDVFKVIILRYIRIVPLYAFIILFNSTKHSRLSNGPVWNYSMEMEKTFCRMNSWANFLMINNYVNADKPKKL